MKSRRLTTPALVLLFWVAACGRIGYESVDKSSEDSHAETAPQTDLTDSITDDGGSTVDTALDTGPIDTGPDTGPVDTASVDTASVDTGPIDTDTTSETGAAELKWVPVEGGSFQMGSTLEADEQPVHGVSIDSFEMAQTEVTVAQYMACVVSGGCTNPAAWGGGTATGTAPDTTTIP